MEEILRCVKLADSKYMRYKELLPKIRYIKKTGVNDKNSMLLYDYIDEISELLEYVKLKYNTEPKESMKAFIEYWSD